MGLKGCRGFRDSLWGPSDRVVAVWAKSTRLAPGKPGWGLEILQGGRMLGMLPWASRLCSAVPTTPGASRAGAAEALESIPESCRVPARQRGSARPARLQILHRY